MDLTNKQHTAVPLPWRLLEPSSLRSAIRAGLSWETHWERIWLGDFSLYLHARVLYMAFTTLTKCHLCFSWLREPRMTFSVHLSWRAFCLWSGAAVCDQVCAFLLSQERQSLSEFSEGSHRCDELPDRATQLWFDRAPEVWGCQRLRQALTLQIPSPR